jgi:uncharacterized membrane protein
VCHQESDKCISIAGQQMFVCARCAGIYFGAIIAATWFFFLKRVRITRKVLLASLAIILSDVFLVFSGVYDYTKGISLVTGILFGSTVYIYLMNELESFFFFSKENLYK